MKQQIAQWLTGGAAWWLLSAFLRAMPAPKDNAGVGYVWLHNFAAIVGANFDRFGAKP